ncbi:hypothetical protein VNO77_15945 [Canavalia gladiata]|uniref:Uncharacterized protein n=1 Tax=Canavalia gladiata TaxID=3824 RepID=A0AAN9M4L6_CANGL
MLFLAYFNKFISSRSCTENISVMLRACYSSFTCFSRVKNSSNSFSIWSSFNFEIHVYEKVNITGKGPHLKA